MKNYFILIDSIFCFTSLSAGVIWLPPKHGEGAGNFVPDPTAKEVPGSRPPKKETIHW